MSAGRPAALLLELRREDVLIIAENADLDAGALLEGGDERIGRLQMLAVVDRQLRVRDDPGGDPAARECDGRRGRNGKEEPIADDRLLHWPPRA